MGVIYDILTLDSAFKVCSCCKYEPKVRYKFRVRIQGVLVHKETS